MKQRLIFFLIHLLNIVYTITAFTGPAHQIPSSKKLSLNPRFFGDITSDLLRRSVSVSQRKNHGDVTASLSSAHTIRTIPILPTLLQSVTLTILGKIASINKFKCGVARYGRKWSKILFASSILWMSSSICSPVSLLPRAHASTPITITRSSTSSKDKVVMDRMVDKYLRKYMFQDDVYESFESTYREVFSDATTGAYPSALADTASFAMGRNKDVQQALKIRSNPDKIFFSKVSAIQDMLFNRYGISKSVSRPILFMCGVVVPLFSLFFLATTFALNQKAMTERMAIKRYGESVLSAEERPEEDDNEEEEEENDDDDDDEDEDDKKGPWDGNKDNGKKSK